MERTAIVGSPRSTRVMKLLEEVEWRLALAFFGKALVERTKIDHHSLMSSAADLFHLVARRHLEFNSFSLDLDYFGFGTNIMTYGRSGKMPYIYRRADRALTHIQKWPDSAEGGIFNDQDHHGGRKHLRQHGVLELMGEMFRQYTQRERSFCSQRNLAHSVILWAHRLIATTDYD